MKPFITSQSSYCLLVCMLQSRKLNNKINAIHDRTLRIAYCDKHSTLQQLLEKDNSFSIHHRNLQVLATEILKVNMNLSLDLMNALFIKKKQIHILYEEMTHFLFDKCALYITEPNPCRFWGRKFGN